MFKVVTPRMTNQHFMLLPTDARLLLR